MIDGCRVVDAHVHAPSAAGLRLDWHTWMNQVDGIPSWARAYDADGRVRPAVLDEIFAAEGVDVALLFSEYSPKVTGTQPIEDMLPIVEHNPARFRLVANVNPHLHHPIRAEVIRQLDLGAVALKVHPVHGGFSPDDKMLYPAYAECEDRGVPVVVHTGPSNFPGASSRYGDPALITDVLRDFPKLTVVLAHGGRGWWYDAAAFLALSYEKVWIDLAGLPPRKLPEYYQRFDLARLATRWIFGTDWPATPGAARNAATLASLGLPEQTLHGVLGGNALAVYPGLAS
ncbi:MAG TPA: amidohydrolase family protein [Pseudonocardiaceae bacterium]